MSKGAFNVSEDTVLLVQVICGLLVLAGFLSRDINYLFAAFAVSLLGVLRVVLQAGVSQKAVMESVPVLSLSCVVLLAYAVLFEVEYFFHALFAAGISFAILVFVFVLHHSKDKVELLTDRMKEAQSKPGDDEKRKR